MQYTAFEWEAIWAEFVKAEGRHQDLKASPPFKGRSRQLAEARRILRELRGELRRLDPEFCQRARV